MLVYFFRNVFAYTRGTVPVVYKHF